VKKGHEHPVTQQESTDQETIFHSEKNQASSQQLDQQEISQKKQQFEQSVVDSSHQEMKWLETHISLIENKAETTQLRNEVQAWLQKNESPDRSQEYDQIRAFFAQEWLTTTDFEAIFDVMIDDLDDLDDVLQKIPWVVTTKSIARIIKQRRLERSRTAEQSKKQHQTLSDEPSLGQERTQAVSEIFLWELLQVNGSELSDQEFVQQQLVEQQQIVAYIIDHRDELDDKQKEKFKKRLQEIMAMYLEWKILEIYEIQVDEDGNITIKTKKLGKNSWSDWEESVTTIPAELRKKNIKALMSIWWEQANSNTKM